MASRIEVETDKDGYAHPMADELGHCDPLDPELDRRHAHPRGLTSKEYHCVDHKEKSDGTE